MGKSSNARKNVLDMVKSEVITPPSDVDAAALEAQRAATIAAALPASHTSAAAADDDSNRIPTSLEAQLTRLGYRSSRQVINTDDMITVNAVSIGDLTLSGIMVSLKGVQGDNKKRYIVQVDTAKVAALVAALPVKSRVKGEHVDSDYVCINMYALKPSVQQTSVNQLRVANHWCALLGDSAIITLDSGVTLNVSTITVKNSKGNDRRKFVCNVAYADSSSESITSYWVQGLGDALRARKLVITGNALVTPTTESNDDDDDESSDDDSDE